MRDDFDKQTKDTLARRVNYHCSNCWSLTSGPQQEPTKTVSIGVAAHITAASPGGARYDSTMSSAERKSIQNGIWLCQNCAKLIDSDPARYTVELIKKWKADAEERVLRELAATHNDWVRKLFDASSPEQSREKTFVAARIDTGKQLFSYLAGSHAYLFDNDQPENEEEVHLMGEFLQDAQDYIDIWDDIGSRDRVLAQFQLDNVIQQLAATGFLVYGCQRKQKMKVRDQSVEDWRVAYLFVFKTINPLVRRKEESLESLIQEPHQVSSEFTSFVLVQHRQ